MSTMSRKGSRKNNPDWEKVSKEQTGNTRDSWRKKVHPAAVGNTKGTSSAKEDFQGNEHSDYFDLVDKRLESITRGKTFSKTLQKEEAESIASSLGMSVHLYQHGKAVMSYPYDYSGGTDYYLLSSENGTPYLRVSAQGDDDLWNKQDTFIQDTTWSYFPELKFTDMLRLKARQVVAENDTVHDVEDLVEELSRESGMEVVDISDIMDGNHVDALLHDPGTHRYYKVYGSEGYSEVGVYGCAEVEPKKVDVGIFTPDRGGNTSFDSPKVNNFLATLNQYSVEEGHEGDEELKMHILDIEDWAETLDLDVVNVYADDSHEKGLNPEGTGIDTLSALDKKKGRYVKYGYLMGDKETGEYVAVQTEYASDYDFNKTPHATIAMMDGKPRLSGRDMWKVTRTGHSERTTWITVGQEED